MHPAEQAFAPFENRILGIAPEPGRMDELHLYHGSRCNRTCNCCCVNGAPEGDHTPFGEEVLRAAVGMVASRGSLKIYGGEPTLEAAGLRKAVGRLRELGFGGAVTIFSNGLRPRVLLDLLETDPRLYVVLNRAIATGEGEEPLSYHALSLLATFEAAYPGRIFLSHDFVVPIGRQTTDGRRRTTDRSIPNPKSQIQNQCWPVLTSSGRFHACPFAVAYDYPQYRLGDVAEDAPVVQRRFQAFKEWITLRVEPEAERLGRHPCEVCCRPARDR
jgi:hypothetical protein